MSQCTIFENIYSTAPHYIEVSAALERIRSGRSKRQIEAIRATLSKGEADILKRQLPSVCFSGKFTKREDKEIISHSGFIVLDFDDCDTGEKAAELSNFASLYAMWVSPRGNGIKALVRIADGKKHRLHFNALKEKFPDVDASGVNESRVCYESYDPNIYINENAEPFTKTLDIEKIQATETVSDDKKIFQNLLKWLTNKGGAFVKGERNTFIFKLASSCCRFGVNEQSAFSMICGEYPPGSDFTTKEMNATIKSAYRANGSKFGTAQFERDVLIDKKTRREVDIKEYIQNPDERAIDVIYGDYVRNNAISLYKNGYESVSGIQVPEIDYLFKSKAGEITALTGIGNYGKSRFKKWMNLMRVLLYGEKFAAFAPEDYPAEEFYNDYVEMLLGTNCTPTNFDGTPNNYRPSQVEYENAYDFISRHIFYIYPETEKASLDYILEKFLELIVKEKISGCCIDPWNQVSHDYASFGANVSKYLEMALMRVSLFAKVNKVYMDLIVHPKAMTKGSDGNYNCPDIFDINDGAMWNNKMDNILAYHRPFKQTATQNPHCQLHSLKIKRQNIVGKTGLLDFQFIAHSRRFEVNGRDPIQDIKNKFRLDFNVPILNYNPVALPTEPVKKDDPMSGFQNRRDPYIDKEYFNEPF